ncbi:hypothetical protein ADIMK_2650 [Marinobacterium lacunae]|uniref:Uncharacterized protein n=1 Tax=Marinobacterium lacunae TaxID=1232683 RepID=A0A081FX71_9GAMM|nr:hypothetical protein [Marinobacterium lacunae]KEA63126.1 hypothetical protein ADIMK_2650 [Marinobacterium lacunae]
MNAITQMLTGNTAITGAMKRINRMKEIEQRLDELSDPRSDAQQVVRRCEYDIEQLEREAVVLPNQRGPRRPTAEIDNDIKRAKTELRQAQSILDQILAEHESLTEEQKSLQAGGAKVTAKDLQAANKTVGDTQAQIERVVGALEQMVISEPTELQAEHDALAAERDLLAADVALGEAPQTELTAMEKQLAALAKKLTGALEAKRTAESTARGYAAKLEQLKTDLVTAEEAFKELMGHWLTAERESVVAEINAATEKLGATYADLCALQSIARRTGATLGGRIPSELNLVVGRHEDLPPDFLHTRFSPGEASAQLAEQRLKKIRIQ